MQNHPPPPLHTRAPYRRTWFNRIFAVLYSCAIIALLYQQTSLLFRTTHKTISLMMLLANLVLAFMWVTYQGFRMSPVRRKTFPENLPKDETIYPAMDVFICTADPYKEPPMVAVNTALSIMAYDYPPEKLSVYLSDDGGSKLTLFAFMEAAKFAKHWLPYCKNNGVIDRCPEAHFSSDSSTFPHTDEIKLMYESMRNKVEDCVASGIVYPEDKWAHAFNHWGPTFTPNHHPTVIEILSDNTVEKDCLGHAMPNLIYISREKNKSIPHKFKAGALNVLLRVSKMITNAPIILTVDCDMYSNNSRTPLEALCYFMDPSADSNIAYIQFPQMFHGIKEDDLYGAAFKFIFQIDNAGMDGLIGPIHVGTGCFFRRRAFYGGPSSTALDESLELSPMRKSQVLAQAYEVASCNFEVNTKWGTEVGYRYGSLVEDFYTGYHLQCLGWKSVVGFPKRPAFLGNAPMSLDDLLNQTKRWSMGLLDVAFSKHSPINHGIKLLPLFQTLCYFHYIFWPIWCIPVDIYALLAPLALINAFPIFPKASNPWILLYGLLFVGSYGQDFLDFKLGGGTTRGWYNNQRMWMVRSLSSYTFGIVEYMLTKLGVSATGFNVTSKVVDEKLNKRYEQGIMEFGVESPFFYPISMAAVLNLAAFISGVMHIVKNGGLEDLLVQMLLASFAMINSWPVYEAMILRNDKGRMPLKITLTSIIFVSMLYMASHLIF